MRCCCQHLDLVLNSIYANSRTETCSKRPILEKKIQGIDEERQVSLFSTVLSGCLSVPFSCCHLPCLSVCSSALPGSSSLLQDQMLFIYSMQLSTRKRQFHIQRNMHTKTTVLWTCHWVANVWREEDLGCFLLKAGALCPSCISISWGICLAIACGLQWPRRPFTLGGWYEAHFLWFKQFSIHDQTALTLLLALFPFFPL